MNRQQSDELDWHHSGELPVFDTPRWFGIAVGRLVFAAMAKEASEARTLVARQLGTTEEYMVQVPTVTRVYPEDYQLSLSELHTGKSVVRLIPYSVIDFPQDLDKATPDQIAALDNLRTIAN